jgi:hypothetical protein
MAINIVNKKKTQIFTRMSLVLRAVEIRGIHGFGKADF